DDEADDELADVLPPAPLDELELALDELEAALEELELALEELELALDELALDEVVHVPQSTGQLEQFSFASHTPLPQWRGLLSASSVLTGAESPAESPHAAAAATARTAAGAAMRTQYVCVTLFMVASVDRAHGARCGPTRAIRQKPSGVSVFLCKRAQTKCRV